MLQHKLPAEGQLRMTKHHPNSLSFSRSKTKNFKRFSSTGIKPVQRLNHLLYTGAAGIKTHRLPSMKLPPPFQCSLSLLCWYFNNSNPDVLCNTIKQPNSFFFHVVLLFATQSHYVDQVALELTPSSCVGFPNTGIIRNMPPCLAS